MRTALIFILLAVNGASVGATEIRLGACLVRLPGEFLVTEKKTRQYKSTFESLASLREKSGLTTFHLLEEDLRFLHADDKKSRRDFWNGSIAEPNESWFLQRKREGMTAAEYKLNVEHHMFCIHEPQDQYFSTLICRLVVGELVVTVEHRGSTTKQLPQEFSKSILPSVACPQAAHRDAPV